MQTREQIRQAKLHGLDKPWTDDPVFQTTYFCNVHREHDKVTQYIRELYSPTVHLPTFEFNIALARLINRPETLEKLPYVSDASQISAVWAILDRMMAEKLKVFGDAYIVSTNGRAMSKAGYLGNILLPALWAALGPTSGWRATWGSNTLTRAYHGLQGVYGLGSFMAGQLIADYKNTKLHPLQGADDYMTWATMGPGSQRGLNYILTGDFDRKEVTKSNFLEHLTSLKKWLMTLGMDYYYVDAQDLQNCLCEFSKYVRVRFFDGHTKRRYAGI